MTRASYDKIVFGAGLYGLYAALRCGRRGESVCVLERDAGPFSRATYVNQARVHMGYHYPRSLSTALKSANYFERFVDDFGFCVNAGFDQIYATSSRLGWTTAAEFERFCAAANIPCEEIAVSKYFRSGMCDGAYVTREYTYDALMLRDYFLEELASCPCVEVRYATRPTSVKIAGGGLYAIGCSDGAVIEAPFVLNATYAGANDVRALAGLEPFPVKYELCEIILTKASDALEGVGITVMDGPFFSVMPFGFTGLHSLTSVTFTPHMTSRRALPDFPCQQHSDDGCAPGNLLNCDTCNARPESAWPSMSALARKYLKEACAFTYEGSLFSMKPIMRASEVDDSRPTVIQVDGDGPIMVSVLSGKINTVYDLDPYLDGEILRGNI